MITPVEIYLFPYDDSVVWADTDESEDGQGVKYVRADRLNKIKTQAIEELINSISRDRNRMYDPEDIKDYINEIRGEK
jgi:hypothetical protein